MVFDGGRFDSCRMEFFYELTDLCVRDGVNFLLVELFEDVLGVTVVVCFVRCGCGVLFGGLEEQIANHCKLFVAVTGIGRDRREEGVFIELSGKLFGTFGCLVLGGFDFVFAVEVAPDPIETRGGSLVNNET